MIDPRFTAGILLVICSGCYTYTPVQPDAVAIGADVRARITAAEAERLREVLPSERRMLEGKVLAGDGSMLMLEVPLARREMARGLELLHQRLSIPRSELIEIEQRSLDRARTGAAALGASLVVLYVLIDRLSGEPASDRPPDPGGGAELVVPAGGFRIRIP